MMSPIANFLPVFSPGSPGSVAARALAFASDLGELHGFGEDAPAGLDPDEVERRIAEARAEVEAEAAAALDAAMAEQAADHAARLSTELDEARRRWTEEQGAILAAQLGTALDALEGSLAESLVHVLEPFFEAAMRAKAAAELRQSVADLLAHGQGVMVKVKGPSDLLDPLQAAFSGRAALDFEPSDEAEVTVESEDTTIRSQLRAWVETLHAYLHEVR